MKEAVPASIMQLALKNLATMLGISGVETFSKQAKPLVKPCPRYLVKRRPYRRTARASKPRRFGLSLGETLGVQPSNKDAPSENFVLGPYGLSVCGWRDQDRCGQVASNGDGS